VRDAWWLRQKGPYIIRALLRHASRDTPTPDEEGHTCWWAQYTIVNGFTRSRLEDCT